MKKNTSLLKQNSKSFWSIFSEATVILLTFVSTMVATRVSAQVTPTWGYDVGSTGNDLGFDVATDASGNRYVIGQFAGTVDFDPGAGTTNLLSAGNTDIFIQKLSSSGALIWAVRFGGMTGFDVGTSIAVDNSGNVYFTGYGGQIDFGGGLVGAATTVEGFVCKLNSSGVYQWAIGLGGTGNQRGRGIAVDAAGINVYVTGEFTVSLSTFSFTAAQQNDAFTAKLSGANGATVWARQFANVGATGQQYGQGVAVDGSGNVYTVGRFEQTVNFNPAGAAFNLASAGGEDVFISKLNSSGDNVWAINLGGTTADSGYDIALDVSGNVYATGSFNGTADFDPSGATSNLVSLGAQDVFIVKISGAGALSWANRIGGTLADTGLGITINGTTNEVGVAGQFSGTMGCGVTSAGGADAFVSFFTTSGSAVITKSMGGTGTESANAIANDGSTYTITGANGSAPADFDPTAGTLSLTTAGGNDVYVANYSALAEPLASLTITKSAHVACLGASIGLTASTGSAFSWSSSGGAFVSTSSNPTSWSAMSSNIFSITVSVECVGTATTTIEVSAPNIASAGSNSPVCLGGAIMLTSSGGGSGGTYTWAGPAGSGFNSTSQNPAGFTAATTSFGGVYTVSVSATTGCTATAITSVSVNALPLINLGYNPICLVGNTLSLSASGGVSYSWKGPNGFSSTNASPASKKSQAADAGIYSVTVTNTNSCTASATIEVYFGAGTISASSNSPVCKGSTIHLSASATHGVSYKWTKLGSTKVWFGANISIPNAKTTNAGLYIVWVTGDNGCISKEDVLVNVINCPGTRLASDEADEIDMEINAYPNPVTNTLTVEVTLKEPSKLSLQLFNSIGNQSGSWQLNEESMVHKTELDMSNLTGGVYLLQAQADKQKVVKRVVKIQY